MKGYIHAAVALAFAALLATPALAAPSAARVTLKVTATGEERSYDNLAAAFHELYTQGVNGFYDTKVLDYGTFGKKEKLLSAERAYFLVNADKAKSAGEDFKVVAFADRKAAADAQKKLGGELRDFNDAWSAVAEYWGVDLDGKPTARAAAQASQPAPRRERHESPAQCFS